MKSMDSYKASKNVGNNESNTKYLKTKTVKSSNGYGLNEQNSKYCKKGGK